MHSVEVLFLGLEVRIVISISGSLRRGNKVTGVSSVLLDASVVRWCPNWAVRGWRPKLLISGMNEVGGGGSSGCMGCGRGCEYRCMHIYLLSAAHRGLRQNFGVAEPGDWNYLFGC